MSKTDIQIYIGLAGLAFTVWTFMKGKELAKEAGKALDITSDTNIAYQGAKAVTEAVGADFNSVVDRIFGGVDEFVGWFNEDPYQPKPKTAGTTEPRTISPLFPSIQRDVKPVKVTGGIVHG